MSDLRWLIGVLFGALLCWSNRHAERHALHHAGLTVQCRRCLKLLRITGLAVR